MVIGTAGSVGNTYLNFMFGSGSEMVSDSIRHSIKNRTLYNRGYLSAIYNGTKDGFIRSHAENIRNGGFFSNFYKNIIETAKEFKIDKSSLKKTGMNFGRGINRAVPIVFAVMSAVDGIPNIYRTFRDKGLKAGLKETTKTVARMTVAALFSTFATSFLRLPLLSGSVGYLAGDIIGGEIGDKLAGFCFGKTYTQKLRAEKKRMQKSQNQTSTDSKPSITLQPSVNLTKQNPYTPQTSSVSLANSEPSNTTIPPVNSEPPIKFIPPQICMPSINSYFQTNMLTGLTSDGVRGTYDISI